MPDIDLFVRHFLGLYFLLIGIQYTSVALGLRRRSGTSHIKYGASGSATWWNRQVFNLFRAAILGICLARIVWPVDAWLGVIPALYQPAVLMAGVLLMLAAYGGIAYVHSYMREDWRSDIDEHKRQPLLTEGPFGRSRNPLFLAIMLGQLGFFLALATTYGDDYRRYRQQVPRWV